MRVERRFVERRLVERRLVVFRLVLRRLVLLRLRPKALILDFLRRRPNELEAPMATGAADMQGLGNIPVLLAPRTPPIPLGQNS